LKLTGTSFFRRDAYFPRAPLSATRIRSWAVRKFGEPRKSFVENRSALEANPFHPFEFVVHYHSERYHQGIGSRLIRPQPAPNADKATLGEVRCRSRLGGQLNFYLREAA